MIRLLLEQPAFGEAGPILLRSKLRAVTSRLGFDEVQRNHMELVCTEILSNQNKYARNTGLLQLWESALCGAALDLFAIDYGPGIPDLASALADGYTTAGTMGRGLGAIERLADTSVVYSLTADHGRPWHGVAIWARFYRMQAACPCGYQAGLFLRAYRDAPASGDRVCIRCEGDRLRWLHLDGLGHGPDAHQAVREAHRAIEAEGEPAEVLARLDRLMTGGRGGVGLAAELDFASGLARVGGVGDITATVVGARERQGLGFEPGVLGRSLRRVTTHELHVAPGMQLITASDGLRRSWSEQTFPGLWRYHPQMIAFMLGNVMGRNNDDKSIFAVRLASETEGER